MISFKVRCKKDLWDDDDIRLLIWKKGNEYDGYTEDNYKRLSIQSEIGPYASVKSGGDGYLDIKDFPEYFEMLSIPFPISWLSKEIVMNKERCEVLLFNAIDMLLAQYDRTDILDNLDMTLDEYKQVMGVDEDE